MTLPLGVKTKTSSYSRSIFSVSMNSPGSEVSCCQSTMRCSHSEVLGRLALLVAPVRGDAELGAAVHLLRCGSAPRPPCPPGPTTVVCNDW